MTKVSKFSHFSSNFMTQCNIRNVMALCNLTNWYTVYAFFKCNGIFRSCRQTCFIEVHTGSKQTLVFIEVHTSPTQILVL